MSKPERTMLQEPQPPTTERAQAVFRAMGYGVVAFVFAFALGTGLTATTGIPLAGGLLNGVITAGILTIGLLHTRFFGSATLMWFVFAVAAILTTTLGPPGPYKVFLGLSAGFIWDVVFFGLKTKRIGLFIGGILGSLAIMGLLIAALYLGYADSPGALERYLGFVVPLLIINSIVTIVGIWVGLHIYKTRLCKLDAFQAYDG